MNAKTHLLLLLALLLVAAASAACDDTQPRDTDALDDTADDAASDADVDEPDTTADIDQDFPDVGTGPYAGLVINELSASGSPDWIELFNRSGESIDLAGVLITDDPADETRRAPIPVGTTVGPRGYALIYVDGGGFPGWALGQEESFAIYTPDGSTVIDETSWLDGQSPDNASWGRIPNATGSFKTLFQPTPGAPNEDNPNSATCGNGTVETGELCDDGNTLSGDGCRADCQPEDGWSCSGMPSMCETTCGDGIRAGVEQCDPPMPPDLTCDAATCTFVVTTGADVRINEVVWDSDDPARNDWIELVNTGDVEVDLGGWRVRDDGDNEFILPPGVVIGPVSSGAYLLMERDGADVAVDFGFGLGSDDMVLLINPSGEIVDVADWREGDAPLGDSYGRLPDATGDFQTLDFPTPGMANTQP